MKRSSEIVVVGYCYESRQNGVVLDTIGIAPTLCVGCHNGVEIKIKMVYETD